MKNAVDLQLQDRLRVLRHTLTETSALPEIDGQLDLIVSNPPYVLTNDLRKVQSEIMLYEDLRALDGGADGLDVIKSILTFAAKRLRPGGSLWLETDPTHPELIKKHLEQYPKLGLGFVASYKDMFKRERFVEITKVWNASICCSSSQLHVIY